MNLMSSLTVTRCRRLHPMRLMKAASVTLIVLLLFNLMISDLREPIGVKEEAENRGNGGEGGHIVTTLTPDVKFLIDFWPPKVISTPPSLDPLNNSSRANLTETAAAGNIKNSEETMVKNNSDRFVGHGGHGGHGGGVKSPPHRESLITPIVDSSPHPTDTPHSQRIPFSTTIEKTEDDSPFVLLPDHPPRPLIMREPPVDDVNATRRYREALRKIQLDINVEQFVHNSRRFGKNPFKSNPDLVVVVVQVHNRSQYLQHLVDSFRQASNIDKILLIFSHDFYSEILNRIIDQIDFCPVLQIFYPYTIQAFPDMFPGKDPRDCPRDIGVAKAKQIKCNNYKHPDKFGHYREAKYTATKHHWWWKIHRIFDELDILSDFECPVLILEEDHYVAKDFLPVLKLMLQLKQKECDSCSLMAVGNYDKKPLYKNGLSGKVSIESWVSSKHNMGMVIDRKNYNNLKKCHREFCKFDDYNWDWSLQFISATCLKAPLQTMVIKSPRVFHIGECGLHHKGKNCTTEARVTQIKKILTDNKEALFPSSLSVNNRRVITKPKPPKPNGGWGDIRDHELCISYVNDKNQ